MTIQWRYYADRTTVHRFALKINFHGHLENIWWLWRVFGEAILSDVGGQEGSEVVAGGVICPNRENMADPGEDPPQ